LREQARYGEPSDAGFAQYNRIELVVNIGEQFAGGDDLH